MDISSHVHDHNTIPGIRINLKQIIYNYEGRAYLDQEV